MLKSCWKTIPASGSKVLDKASAVAMSSINPYQPFMSDGVAPAVVPSKLPVRVTGQITADDAIASLKAAGKWRTWRVSVLILALLVAFTLASMTNRRRKAAWPVPIATIVASVFVLTAPLRTRHRFVKAWNARTEYQHPVSWTFSPEGLLTETISSKTLRDWSGFLYAKITGDRIVLAQPGDVMFNFVPRRYFESEGDWAAVCQLVATKLPLRG